MANFTDNIDAAFARLQKEAAALVERTCQDFVAGAQARVRVDTSDSADDIILRDSITYTMVGPTEGLVYIEGEANKYALVQEYGHPRYPQYGFTPYWRPTTEEIGPRFAAEAAALVRSVF